MIRFLARDSVTFDTETVPDVEAGRRLHTLGPAVYLKDRLSPAEMEEFGAKDDDYEGHTDLDVINELFHQHPDYDPVENPRPFLKPVLQKVVSIALVRRVVGRSDGPPVELKVLSGDEKTLIRKFLTGIGSNNCQLVGFASSVIPSGARKHMIFAVAIMIACAAPAAADIQTFWA